MVKFTLVLHVEKLNGCAYITSFRMENMWIFITKYTKSKYKMNECEQNHVYQRKTHDSVGHKTNVILILPIMWHNLKLHISLSTTKISWKYVYCKHQPTTHRLHIIPNETKTKQNKKSIVNVKIDKINGINKLEQRSNINRCEILVLSCPVIQRYTKNKTIVFFIQTFI